VVDRVAPPPSGITILTYHRVGGGTGGPVDLGVAEFREQLAVLAEHCRVLGLDEAVGELQTGPGCADGVVLTFDDGTADFADHVVPALVDAGLPALLYLASGFVEDGRPFAPGVPPVTWSALRDAAQTGIVTVGSHTHDHLVLRRLAPAAARDNLLRSVDTIGDRLDCRPLHFAYPKAVIPPASVAHEVRRLFSTASVAGNRVNTGDRHDRYRLTRSPVRSGMGIDGFLNLARGGGRLEGGLRAAVAPLRYWRSPM